MWTYKLLPGGGTVAFQTEKPLPRLWLRKLHSLPCSFPLPRTLHSTAGERLSVSRVPESSTNNYNVCVQKEMKTQKGHFVFGVSHFFPRMAMTCSAGSLIWSLLIIFLMLNSPCFLSTTLLLSIICRCLWINQCFTENSKEHIIKLHRCSPRHITVINTKRKINIKKLK